MDAEDPIDLLFGGMAKLGPGGDLHSLRVLRSLPRRRSGVVVDAGCGSGRQTLVLARELGTMIHAVDSHEPFLRELTDRAEAVGLGHLIATHCMDMKDVPAIFPQVDLLWAEGSAYSIGFHNALATWKTAIVSGGFLVASELCWLRDTPPESARDFFQSGYPEMRSVPDHLGAIAGAGYELLSTYTLPGDSWTEGYYDVLEPRAQALVSHPTEAVRDLASETLREIEVFRESQDSYGYVFFTLRRR